MSLHDLVRRGWSVVCRRLDRVHALLLVWWLSIFNRLSKSTAVDPLGPVVSLTTYGYRLSVVHLVIESIARGNLRPSRIILWVDDLCFLEMPTPAIERLKARGLEVRRCRDLGPHKKYYPFVEEHGVLNSPLVTADDDVLYPKDWLTGLVSAFRANPKVVNCYRARIILLDRDGLLPYEEWPLCSTTRPSFGHFATGVSGVIYPVPLLEALRNAGTSFLQCCPKADDIWLHVQALRLGFRARQISSKARHFPTIPGTQQGGLQNSNAYGRVSGNDQQARLTYHAEDLDVVRQDLAFGVQKEEA